MGVGEELSPRKKQILKALIDAHIENGEPVGSKYLTSAGGINYSSATVRNEMSELEEMGYLVQPHTSAGRIPSKLGYRFYVDALMQAYSLTAHELEELNHMQNMRMAELDKILRAAGKLIASMTNYTALAVKPKPAGKTVECFKTVFIDERNYVLNMIMSDRTVQSKYMYTPFEINEEILNRLCGVLNNTVTSMSSEKITLPLIMKMESDMGVFDSLISPVIKAIYEACNRETDGDLKLEGVDRLLEYPEFTDIKKLRRLLSALENKEDIMQLVESSESDDVSIYIGGDDNASVVGDSSMILQKLIVDGKVVGAIGVIGPRRMEYSKVVAMVKYLAECISTMMDTGKSENLKLPRNKADEEGDNNSG